MGEVISNQRYNVMVNSSFQHVSFFNPLVVQYYATLLSIALISLF